MGYIKIPTMQAKLLAEFLGTFILVFTVCCDINGNNGADNNLSCLSIAASLMVAIYALGSVSGANFNPAVTTGLLCAGAVDHGDMHGAQAGLYILVQLAGGFFGGLSAALLYRANEVVVITNIAVNATSTSYFDLKIPHESYNAGQIFGAEMFYTALLVFVVLSVATTQDYESVIQEKNQYFGLCIGFVIMAGATAIGHISGCSLNPAVSFGITMNSAIFKDSVGIGDAFKAFALYSLAELVGGVLGFCFFFGCRKHYLDHDHDARELTDAMGTPIKPVPSHVEEAFAEFLGTFYLVLTIAFVCMAGTPPVLGCVGIACALMVMIYSLGAVSGANFNPAVSLGLLIVGELPAKECVIYIFSQFLGAVVAMAVAWSIELDTKRIALIDEGPNGVAKGKTWAIVGGEFFYTFLLVFVVLNVAVADAKNQYYGLAIGFVIVAGAVAEGGISGGCFNPAVAFGLDVSALWMGGETIKFGYSFLYMVVQFAAAALAAGLWKLVRQTERAETYDDVSLSE